MDLTGRRTYVDSWIQPSLRDLKRNLRITTGDMDEELHFKLLAAVNSAENYIGKVIALSRFDYQTSFAPSISLSGPAVAVDSVTVDGQETAIFALQGDVLTFPDTMSGETVRVRYRAGMEETPHDIMQAILMHASYLFTNPLDSVETLPKASSRLLRPYRTWGL